MKTATSNIARATEGRTRERKSKGSAATCAIAPDCHKKIKGTLECKKGKAHCFAKPNSRDN